MQPIRPALNCFSFIFSQVKKKLSGLSGMNEPSSGCKDEYKARQVK